MEQKINYYGITELTKRNYLILQGVVFVVIVALYVLPETQRILGSYTKPVLMVVALAEACEVFYFMHKFKQKSNTN